MVVLNIKYIDLAPNQIILETTSEKITTTARDASREQRTVHVSRRISFVLSNEEPIEPGSASKYILPR
jgi:hypothetical protein